MNKLIVIFFFYFSLSSISYGASFDCNKASSVIEKVICTDKTLGDLDDSLQQTYKKALENSQDTNTLKTGQLEWLKNVRNRCSDKDCLTQVYTSRLMELNKQTKTIEALKAGEYLTEGGWGYLKISEDEKALTHFSIEAMGGNGHSCSLAGVIREGKSIPDEQEGNEPKCVVNFVVKKNGVEVTPQDSSVCSYFCGMRAQFEGLYLNVAQNCVPSALKKTRNKFKQLYDKKSYAEAYALLQPTFQQCEKTLDWLEDRWWRNDLALTAYKLGDMSNCKKWLQPLLAELGSQLQKSDEILKNDYTSFDYENIMPIIKATRTNAKLCGIR